MSRQQQLYTGGEVTDDEKMYTRWVKMYLFQLEVSPRVCILTIGDSVLDDQRLKWKPCNAFFLLERNSQLIQNATLFFISALSFMTQPCKRGRLFPVSQRICTPIDLVSLDLHHRLRKNSEYPLRPIYTARLCRMRQAYDRPTTWLKSRKRVVGLIYTKQFVS